MLIKLFPLLGKDSTLTVSTKLHIYKTIIRPMLTYTAPIWCSMSTSAYRQLEVVQNKCLRVLANAPRGTPITTLLTSLGMETIQSYSRRLAASFYDACLEHSNPLIRSIGNYTLQDLSQVYRKYKHKRPKHCLIWVRLGRSVVFFFCFITFSLLTTIMVRIWVRLGKQGSGLGRLVAAGCMVQSWTCKPCIQNEMVIKLFYKKK